LGKKRLRDDFIGVYVFLRRGSGEREVLMQKLLGLDDLRGLFQPMIL